MTTVQIDSSYELGPDLPGFPRSAIKAEPMLFNCDLNAALRMGGPITHAFLRAVACSIPFNFDAAYVVDTRVQMLMPGWYPCIPGWHHDDVPRTRSDGQPDYLTPEYKAIHAMATVGDEVSQTELATGSGDFELPPVGQVISGPLHDECERRVRTGKLKLSTMPIRRVLFFDSMTWHRGVAANGHGWRWWGRISANTHRVPTNERRQQVQVYLDANSLNAGW